MPGPLLFVSIVRIQPATEVTTFPAYGTVFAFLWGDKPVFSIVYTTIIWPLLGWNDGPIYVSSIVANLCIITGYAKKIFKLVSKIHLVCCSVVSDRKLLNCSFGESFCLRIRPIVTQQAGIIWTNIKVDHKRIFLVMFFFFQLSAGPTLEHCRTLKNFKGPREAQ